MLARGKPCAGQGLVASTGEVAMRRNLHFSGGTIPNLSAPATALLAIGALPPDLPD